MFCGKDIIKTEKQYIKSIACLSDCIESQSRLEFEVVVSNLQGNVFDYEHITLDFHFKDENGTQYVHPAFFYRGFEFENLYLGNPKPENDSWRIRITPKVCGIYKANLVLTIDGIEVENVYFDFNVCKGKEKRGQITVEPINRRTFIFEDGSPFTAIGENVCWSGSDVRWPSDSKYTTSYIEDIYKKLHHHSANWVRLWMSPSYNGIIPRDDEPSNLYSGLGGAILTDRLFEALQENDLYVDLVLFYHGMFDSRGDNKNWENCPFNINTNGGYLRNPAEFFVDEQAKKDTKIYIRYLIARYGYSRNLFCWELFNEADSCEADPDDVLSWHRDMTQFIRQNDCHSHMITTSACRNRNPLIFDDIYEFISMHRYGEPDNAKLIVHEAYMAATEFKKPILVAESGNSWRGPLMSLITRHQSVWTGIMGNTAGTAMNWWWDRVDEYEKEIGKPLSCYKDFEIAAKFACRIPRNNPTIRFVMRERLACNKPFTEAMGYNGKNFVYLWIYDSRFTRKNPEEETIETADFEVLLENGEYKVEWFDTWSGDIVKTDVISVRGEFAHISSPSFKRDIAVAIEKMN